MSSHVVELRMADPRAIAAVRARLPIADVPARFAEFLNEVYTAGRRGAVVLDGQNIFVYRDGPDGVADVEFGVGTTAPFAPVGPVQYTALPAGEAAATTHWGDYAGLRNAHAAVLEWCRREGRQCAGPRWEVYGHWNDDPSQRRTDVYHLLRGG